ncbi:ribosome silencing factor [Cohaesibacter celericrescens]|uniref:Ribosomal silencing factor RsfS n=1 Tax=Cohaesibacter celericrescens TaxID=2067669 RepID=A0A2N5XPL1_9HYPH|nr:ribosome silencing factor [Cohaesibacter celericrescens]PLW76415.1 ribosome silencing factor [Cohaesibacter celericrescens]
MPEGPSPVSPVLDRKDPEQALDLILTSLDDSKAEEILPIDLRGKSSLADYMIIASGRSHRHVGAVADRLLRDLKDNGLGNAHVEGMPNCDWVLIDTGDHIVHIFRPEVREFYNIEKMWTAESEDEA